jgi:hypothetical protein
VRNFFIRFSIFIASDLELVVKNPSKTQEQDALLKVIRCSDDDTDDPVNPWWNRNNVFR